MNHWFFFPLLAIRRIWNFVEQGSLKKSEGNGDYTLLMDRPTAIQLYRTWVMPRTNKNRWSCSRPSWETKGSRPCNQKFTVVIEATSSTMSIQQKCTRDWSDLPHHSHGMEGHWPHLWGFECYLSMRMNSWTRDFHWCWSPAPNKGRICCWEEMNLHKSRKSTLPIVPTVEIWALAASALQYTNGREKRTDINGTIKMPQLTL